MVRAKFKVVLITKYDGGQDEIKLMPVCGGSEENKTFWKYTPSGSISLTCVNPEATKQFELGKEYYVDFNPAFVPVEAGVPEEPKCEAETPCCQQG